MNQNEIVDVSNTNDVNSFNNLCILFDFEVLVNLLADKGCDMDLIVKFMQTIMKQNFYYN